LFHHFCHVTVKILYTKIRNKRYLNANKIIEIQKNQFIRNKPTGWKT
jgi:hypothetical protein